MTALETMGTTLPIRLQIFLMKKFGKHGNVVKAVTQRRNGDRKKCSSGTRDPRGNPPVRTSFFQVAIGGGKNSGIHFYGPGAAETLEFAVLNHPQQLRL